MSLLWLCCYIVIISVVIIGIIIVVIIVVIAVMVIVIAVIVVVIAVTVVVIDVIMVVVAVIVVIILVTDNNMPFFDIVQSVELSLRRDVNYDVTGICITSPAMKTLTHVTIYKQRSVRPEAIHCITSGAAVTLEENNRTKKRKNKHRNIGDSWMD